MFSISFALFPLLLLWQPCLGMPQSRSLADDAAWYRGGGRTQEGAWYKGGRNSQLGRWFSGGRGDKVDKVEEETKEEQSEELRREEEEEEEEPTFERLTKVDEEEAGGRNELFYDLQNIEVGVWYQWNQGRLQIIKDKNTTETLNAKLKTEGLIDNLDLEA